MVAIAQIAYPTTSVKAMAKQFPEGLRPRSS
jgi:hypothetical protein